MPQYSPAFKSRMLRRLVGPSAMSANALAKELGVGQPLLSRWLRESRNVEDMASSKKKKWTGAEKLRVVIAARGLSETELGALPLLAGRSSSRSVHGGSMRLAVLQRAASFFVTSRPRVREHLSRDEQHLWRDHFRRSLLLGPPGPAVIRACGDGIQRTS
jgi:hypothetical protein